MRKKSMELQNKNNMKFNSQICTSKSQSEALLKLGLKKETADCCYYYYDGEYLIAFAEDAKYPSDIPAWSLHRLIEMMPEEMYGGLLCIFKDSIRYEEVIMDRLEAHFEVVGDNMYENAISCIEWLIKEGYFNKEYLNGND